MKLRIEILLAAFVILAASCKKENTTTKSSGVVTGDHLTDNIELGAGKVKIGTQVWMKKNLDVKYYRNGDPIPQVKNSDEWFQLTTGAWCWYKNSSANDTVYGKLYNWYAVNDPRGLAPAGWHVPGDEEWQTLTTFLGGINASGGKMKATGYVQAGTGLWQKPNTDATNSSGFTALPGGYRPPSGPFQFINEKASWWSSTVYTTSSTSFFYINYYAGDLNNSYFNKKYGFSVRCIKD